MVSRMRQQPQNNRLDAGRGTATISRRQAVWLLGLLCGVVVLLALGGEPARLALRYERSAVMAGEYWRLVTGHLVHSSVAHLLLNMAGVGLIAALFPRDYSLRQWLLILASSAAFIDFGFVFYQPQLQWYVGLSGVLHGALAAGAVAWWRHETSLMALLLSLLLAGKLLWEQLHGALPFSGDMPVIVDAHLLGASGGLLAALLIWLGLQDWPARRRSL
jgi:rhomboid family GlyGly-CTERM serine protease